MIFKRSIAIGIQVIGLNIFLLSCSSDYKTNDYSFGLSGDGLKPCEERSKCICSLYPQHEENYYKPWIYKIDAQGVKNRINDWFEKVDGVEVLEMEENYLLTRFNTIGKESYDLVEFYFPENEKKVHFRSISYGSGLLNVHKKRLNTIEKLLIRKGILWE